MLLLDIKDNRVLRMIKRNKNQYGDPFIYNDRSNHLLRAEYDSNHPFRVLEGDGATPPQIIAAPFVAHQMVDWAQIVRQSGYETTGVNPMAATGEKPAGLRSGKALLTYYDIGAERLGSVSKNYQQLIVDESWQIIRVLSELGGSAKTRVLRPNKRHFYVIKWKEVALDEDQFAVSVRPGSSLPHEPAGREERVGLRMQEGIIDRGEARQLLGWSDLEKFDRLANAEREYLMDLFEGMLEGGEYVDPLPCLSLGGMDPQTGQVVPGLSQDLCTQYILRSRCDDVPEEQVVKLERWLKEANEIVEEQTQIAAAGMMQQQQEQMSADPGTAQMLAQAQATMPTPGPAGPMPPQGPGGPGQLGQ